MKGLEPVFLHVGTMKSGTSYIQQVLHRNFDALEREGLFVRYANGGRGLRRAIIDVIHSDAPCSDEEGDWMQFAKSAREHPGKVIISSELLGFAKDRRAREIIESFRPRKVTVIITARDFVRLIPSAWQEKIKHGGVLPFGKYVDNVVNDDGPQARLRKGFWNRYDVGKMVRRWVDAAGLDRVVVVTVPGKGAPPTELWDRFAAVCGLDAKGYDTTLNRGSNLSLGYAESELVRLVNLRLSEHDRWKEYQPIVQEVLARDVLRPDPNRSSSSEARPTLTREQHAWAARKSRELQEAVAATGVRVVGSLDELVSADMTDEEARSAPASTPPQTSAQQVEAVAALVQRIADGKASKADVEALFA
jgi:hypothetical protein